MKKLHFILYLLMVCCCLGGIAFYQHTQLSKTQELRRAFLEDYNDRYILRLLKNLRSERRSTLQGIPPLAGNDMPFIHAGYGVQIDCCHEGNTYTRSYIVSMLPEEAELILKEREELPRYYRHSMLNDVNVTRGMTFSIDTCPPPNDLEFVTDKQGHAHPATCVRFLFEDTAAGKADPSPRRSSCVYIQARGAGEAAEGE